MESFIKYNFKGKKTDNTYIEEHKAELCEFSEFILKQSTSNNQEVINSNKKQLDRKLKKYTLLLENERKRMQKKLSKLGISKIETSFNPKTAFIRSIHRYLFR